MTDRSIIRELICERIRYFSEQEEMAEEAIYFVRWQERRVALEHMIKKIDALPAPEQPVEQQEGKAERLQQAICDVASTKGAEWHLANHKLLVVLKDIFGEK